MKQVEEFVIQDTKFKGQENSGTALELIETTAQIVHSTFVSNRKGSYRKCIFYYHNHGCHSDRLVGGAIIVTNSAINISQSKFEHNGADWGGAIFAEQNSFIIMSGNVFFNNSATYGGVLDSYGNNITIEESVFHGNNASYGGILHSSSSDVTIAATEFHNNSATYGGVLCSFTSAITIQTSEFHDNNATFGGVLDSYNSEITMEDSEFHDNSARYGGVLNSSISVITIDSSGFRKNSATYGGVLDSSSDYITLEICKFHGSTAREGGVINFFSSIITIEACEFNNNKANYGGVLYSYRSNITIETSEFDYNRATFGGILHSSSSDVTIEETEFHNNSATYGGVLQSFTSAITIQSSQFHANSATYGGVMDYSTNSIVTIEASGFHHNSATRYGGVLRSFISTITIEASGFHGNSATREGGVLHSSSSTITIGGSNLIKNSSPKGAVIYSTDTSIQHHGYDLLIDSNSADRYAAIYLIYSTFIAGNLTFSSNLGSLAAYNSNIIFTGHTAFLNNQPSQITTGEFLDQEGGAITLTFQSNVFFDGILCNLEHNTAENGGAIHSTESKLFLNGNVTIALNIATKNGGGVYLKNSQLNCLQNSTFVLFNNTALHKGGGLHAISSSINATSTFGGRYTGTRISFTKKLAKKGGGLSLEANAKLYILKYDIIFINETMSYDTNTTIFTANKADYGGAVYVDDDTISGTCASEPKTECFFQVLAIHEKPSKFLQTLSIYFSQNYAKVSGSTLYGGLLDRCAVNRLAEVCMKYACHSKDGGEGVAYFKNVSIPTYYAYESTHDGPHTQYVPDNDLSIITVSSQPVRVCLCRNNEQNCSHQTDVNTKKGERFTLSVAAVDQIGQPVSATIQSSLNITGCLAKGQLIRKIPADCTNLTFSVVSHDKSETLTLYALDGPCNDAALSKRKIEVRFLPCSCPIGFQVRGINNTNCTCECHSDISQYVKQCNSHTGSFVKQQPRAWISYINDTNLTGYLVYPNCPFDYCLSTSPPVDLNQRNGADAQCAFNRSSLLCGSCHPDLSLSLGSSHCLPCPSYWPALLIAITIAAMLAGVGLVALLLELNMTVAVGTLNGLIFYTNVVYANKSILLPFQKTNFIAIFISWLNLDLGLDTCYFPRMDTYIKTWLQLAFPAYVILLVVIVIIISSYSSKFSNLIGKKDPVATLATLILLSYAKLLEICFKSLSVGILEYPDGSSKMLWLPDASVRYLSRKHIPLFIAAVLILLVGLVYTVLLFSWQWLLYLPRWNIFGWSRNPKIQTFIETYHTPYTPKHRYWTGLLLIARIVLYLASAVNITNNPTVALTAINLTVSFVVLLKGFIGSLSKVYKKWLVDMLETFFYLNILLLVTFTWYSLDNPDSNQEAAAYTSVIITFITLLLIIFCHVYTYTIIFSKVKSTKFSRMIENLFTKTDPKPKPEHCWNPPPDDDIHRFNELLDMIDRPVNTNDYKVPLKQKPAAVKPTQSVVEVYHPYLTPPDPEEATNTQQIPGQTTEAIRVEVNKESKDQNGKMEQNISKCCIEQKISTKESQV